MPGDEASVISCGKTGIIIYIIEHSFHSDIVPVAFAFGVSDLVPFVVAILQLRAEAVYLGRFTSDTDHTNDEKTNEDADGELITDHIWAARHAIRLFFHRNRRWSVFGGRLCRRRSGNCSFF